MTSYNIHSGNPESQTKYGSPSYVLFEGSFASQPLGAINNSSDVYGVLGFLGDDHDASFDRSNVTKQRQLNLSKFEIDDRNLLSNNNTQLHQQNHPNMMQNQQNLQRSAFFDKPASLQIPSNDVFCAPPSVLATSRNNSFDYGASSAPLTPSSSPYSAASSRNNSVDMESHTFNAGMYQHQQYKRQQQQMDRQVDSPSVRYPSKYDLPPSPREPTFTVAPSPLQATGGGTAAITPELAEALTVAQVQLSQRKKQRDTFPPMGYICRLCSIEGHWMENCILYKSNKHPQYNNAARAVALNIISEKSQHVLEALPVVQQPKQKFTPKFYQEYQQQQLQLQQQQQQEQQQQRLRRQQRLEQEQQYYSQLQQEQRQYQQQQQQFYRSASTEYHSFAPPSPTNSAGSGSRFEGLWVADY
ncbi:UNVERIFIED_CONTAM: hypothetical protein HDU68_000006 [Siphonaria sp. JEL0065]|nr:hypothetical protein HDU68_000006 [Siphonaria sp. JEL0065]